MADEKEKKELSVEVSITKLDAGVLYLHEQLASGTFGEKEFTVDRIPSNGNIIVSIGKHDEHQKYEMSTNEMVRAVLEFHFEKGGKDIEVKPIEKIKHPDSKK